MSVLHLHCMKDETRLGFEAAAIARAGGLPRGALASFRPFQSPVDDAALEEASAAIIGGSDWSVFEEIPHDEAFRASLQEIRRRKIPMFGICFGAQALAQAFGGTVIRDNARAEYGSIRVRGAAAGDPLFSALPEEFHAQAWHQDRISVLPALARAIAWSQNGAVVQAFAFEREPIWGVQFHPEHTHDTFDRLLDTRPAPCAEHPIEKIRASLVPTPRATMLLTRFLRAISI